MMFLCFYEKCYKNKVWSIDWLQLTELKSIQPNILSTSDDLTSGITGHVLVICSETDFKSHPPDPARRVVDQRLLFRAASILHLIDNCSKDVLIFVCLSGLAISSQGSKRGEFLFPFEQGKAAKVSFLFAEETWGSSCMWRNGYTNSHTHTWELPSVTTALHCSSSIELRDLTAPAQRGNSLF